VDEAHDEGDLSGALAPTPTCDAVNRPWWGGWGSNPRPTDYESAALTG
jgi:hypothetical protein